MQPDVVMVGGGIIGLATSYELARHGLAVLVLERGQVGDGVSGVGGGFVSQFGQQSYPMRQLLRESLSEYHSLGERLGADIGLRASGGLLLAADEVELAALGRAADELAAAGVPVERWSVAQAREVEPHLSEQLAGLLYSPTDVQIEPRRLMQAYRGALERLGSEVREHRVVVGLRRDADRVVGVRTQYGDIDAGLIVIAAGCWTPALLPPSHAALVRPRRGQVLVAAPRRRCIRHLLLGADYLSAKFAGASVGFTLEQTVDGVLRLGGTREWTAFDPRPTALLNTVQERAGRYVRLPDEVVWSHALAGPRPATLDGLPLLGQLEPHLFLAVGHEGSGFALAPATAARLSDAIRGMPADLHAFQPWRFMTPVAEP